MRSDTTKYIIGFLAAVGLIVVVIVLMVRSLVSVPSQSATTTLVPDQPSLTSYADTGTTVQLTIDSPIVAPANHHDVSINVGRDQTTLTITKGYNGEVVASRAYAMSANAYGVFLKALLLNGFTFGNTDPAVKDEGGHCALGDRFIYQIIDANGQTIQRFWSTTCGTGTFTGDGVIIRSLFRSQAPDYTSLTQNLQF